ncbi:hypothetical protein DXZ20_34920 [Leptolyngbyaceae cyanobacterium CCMR0081]|uniref:Uncharacterized protein n=1 Tax=Adonisia turfae CCMR0081 TaxID=2292702 RepID=A0A6M0RX75_9CYAN|nr:hypothetical protein [Adonisia turfae CCMR0081]
MGATCLLVFQSAEQPASIPLGLLEIKDREKLQLSLDNLTPDTMNSTSLQWELNKNQQIFQLFMPGRCRMIWSDVEVSCEFCGSLSQSLINLDRSNY